MESSEYNPINQKEPRLSPNVSNNNLTELSAPEIISNQNLHPPEKNVFPWLSIVFNIIILVFVLYSHFSLSLRLENTNARLFIFESRFSSSIMTIQSNFDSIVSNEDYLRNSTTNFLTQSSKNITKLASQFNSYESETNTLFNQFQSQIQTHDSLLTRLTNGTSNVDVLDKLRETKIHIDTQLSDTTTFLSRQMQLASTNVSSQLRRNDNKLNSTLNLMQGLNMTQRLSLMQQSLSDRVLSLDQAVAQAQTSIQSQVDSVQANIEKYVEVTNKQFAAENDFFKYQLAGTFTLLACLISGYHFSSHLRHYSKPDVQKRVMAVLWMVPIYGITSWMSLVFPDLEGGLSVIRDLYEAYVVYTFIALLIAIMQEGRSFSDLLERLARQVVEERQAVARYKGGEEVEGGEGEVDLEGVSEGVKRKRKVPKEHIRPMFPCCYVHHRPHSVASAWLYQCQMMALQFVMLKPLLILIPALLSWSGVPYEEQPLLLNGAPNWSAGRLYVILLQNLSVALAFMGLLSFYHGTEKDLAWCNPWPKFLCIKGVVFMTFWQGATLQVMGTMGAVDLRAASQIQNFLICIEMLIASLAHFYIFPHYEWQEGYKRAREQSIHIHDTLALRDFMSDVGRMVTRWETKEEPTTPPAPDLSHSLHSSSSSHLSETTPLLSLSTHSAHPSPSLSLSTPEPSPPPPPLPPPVGAQPLPPTEEDGLWREIGEDSEERNEKQISGE